MKQISLKQSLHVRKHQGSKEERLMRLKSLKFSRGDKMRRQIAIISEEE